MSFKQLLLDQVQNLMRIMANGELAVSSSYYSYNGRTYDATTRTNTPSYSAAETVNAIFTKLDEEEGIPTEKSAKVLIAAADLTAVPKEQDRIDAMSDVWFVDRIMNVPGESIYILKVVRDVDA